MEKKRKWPKSMKRSVRSSETVREIWLKLNLLSKLLLRLSTH